VIVVEVVVPFISLGFGLVGVCGWFAHPDRSKIAINIG
jgi:hypothetical protein